jgi:diadenosine tetraphosphate (Ap4A) HIT family hydrolase
MSSTCLFCKIVAETIPCHKIYETPLTLAFLDINPLSKGHALVIPKSHARFMHELDDASLADILPVVKKVRPLIILS